MQAVIGGVGGMGTNFSIEVYFFDSSNNFLGNAPIYMPKSSTNQASDMRSQAAAVIATFCTVNSLPQPDKIWYGYDFETLPASNVTGLATVATSGLYSDLTGIPVSPVTYQAIVSQTGTSAPTLSNTPINTYPSTPTFTWARTAAGTYTVTASSAVFSLTKTIVLNSSLPNPLANLTYTVTSTTVITIKTSINSLLSLLGLGFNSTPTDALLSNTMVYVQNLP